MPLPLKNGMPCPSQAACENESHLGAVKARCSSAPSHYLKQVLFADS